ncbi:nuclear transport factor 2 family protein [Marinobacter sp. ANT_B65]|uniref:nuclear transport factor 2 family protein n=1 Tax=Marinobacter sp. ANT_B65 TaxID=2039467 RepID=UPI000BBE3A66|nr:nuclear transport factor 2 family protein [Marinobacter sp. ANT_B65]PCM46143.1 hypothetical protein CPA50_09420 [Marinobacter sp. ANT_B65]
MLSQLFQAIDNQDATAFADFLTEDCTFSFGNQPPVCGKEAVRDFVAGFFSSIEAVSHSLLESWEVTNGSICQGTVRYTRKDGSTLTVPFANILKLREGLVSDYRIFADTSELYQQG